MRIEVDNHHDSCGRPTWHAVAFVTHEEWDRLVAAGCLKSGDRYHKDTYMPGCGWSDTYGGPYMLAFERPADDPWNGTPNYRREGWPNDGRTPHYVSNGSGFPMRVGGQPVDAVVADWVPVEKTPCAETGNEFNS